jgi:hypothetical protein
VKPEEIPYRVRLTPDGKDIEHVSMEERAKKRQERIKKGQPVTLPNWVAKKKGSDLDILNF